MTADEREGEMMDRRNAMVAHRQVLHDEEGIGMRFGSHGRLRTSSSMRPDQ